MRSARVVLGLVCVLGDATAQHEPSVSVTSSLEDVFGGLVAQGGGGGRNVIEIIETPDQGNAAQLGSLLGRIGSAAMDGGVDGGVGGGGRRRMSLLERLIMMSRHRPPPRRHTPKTIVGGVLLPFLAACVMAYFIAKRFFPDAFAELLRRAFASRPAVHAFALAEAAREAAVRLTRTRTRTPTPTPTLTLTLTLALTLTLTLARFSRSATTRSTAIPALRRATG